MSYKRDTDGPIATELLAALHTIDRCARNARTIDRSEAMHSRETSRAVKLCLGAGNRLLGAVRKAEGSL